MQCAAGTIARASTGRMEVIDKVSKTTCVDKCNGQYLQVGPDLLQNNQVHPIIFVVPVKGLLRKDRGKFRDIMIVGAVDGVLTVI